MNNENNNNNKDKKQDIKKEIIDYYINADDKKKAIEYLREKYDFSLRWLYQILKESNIATPSKFKNNINSDNIKKPEIVLQSFDDLKIYSDSLIQKFKDHGFYDEDKAQRAMNIHIYAEENIGIDVWEGYWDYLLQLIYEIEKKQLQSDIKEIKAGHFKKLKTVDTVMKEMAISSAEEIQDALKPKVVEPSEPEQETQQQDFDLWGNLIMVTNPKMFGLYKMITDNNFRDIYLKSLKHFQQFSRNLKNKNLKQRKAENVKPKERDVDLKQQELNLNQRELRKLIISSMPEPNRKGKREKKNLKNGAKMK